MATMDNLVAISTAVALQEAESKSRIAWWAPEDGNTGCPEDEQDGRGKLPQWKPNVIHRVAFVFFVA